MTHGNWQAVEGADYYRVYHHDRADTGCRPEPRGHVNYCKLLADNVLGTSYTHSGPDPEDNYYWVVACNNSGCSRLSDATSLEGWSAAEFIAKHHIIDGNISLTVRVDPNCAQDCETAMYPGDGSRSFETMKAVTGIDLGLSNPGQGRYIARVRDRVSKGEIGNLRVVLSDADIDIAQKNGGYAVMFYLQRRPPSSPWQLDGDVTRLRDWYDKGLRVLQLAYGSGREDARDPDERLGYGHSEGEEKGLTALGSAAIAEMNAMGMIVDVSHCSRQTTLDAAAASAKPIIANHVNAETLTPVTRNKDDEELIAIAETGGVIGVTAIRRYLDTDGDGSAGMDDMIAHIEYMVELVGIDHVGVSSDARIDGWERNSGYYADADLAAPDRWVRLASRLYARGWIEEDLAKLLGGNFRRVFAEVLAAG